MNSLFASVVRTLVPVTAGAVLASAAMIGLDLNGETVTIAVTSAIVAAYYTAFRSLEAWTEKVGSVRLRRILGWFLGWARPPQYPRPPDDLTAELGKVTRTGDGSVSSSG